MPTEIGHSQNFLTSARLVSELVDLANISSADTVVEVGPGRGIITRELARRSKQVIAIEKDPRLADRLKGQFQHDFGNINVVNADFLNARLPDDQYKVVANIPFNITADIVRKLFLEGGNHPETAHLVIQREAVTRFVGESKATLISNLLKVGFDINVLRSIDQRSFEPSPRVDAAYIAFLKREVPQVSRADLNTFKDFLAFGYVYAKRDRPDIFATFEPIFSHTQRSILRRNLSLGDQSVTDLDIEQWKALFEAFKKQVSKEKQVIVRGTMAKLERDQSGIEKQNRTRKRR